MELAAALLALLPIAGMLLLMLLALRASRRWRTRPLSSPGAGGDHGGVREPRRPLVPAGAAGAALPEPDDGETAPGPHPGPTTFPGAGASQLAS